MTMIQIYQLIAKDGEEATLRQALQDLAGKVAPLPGCEGVEIMHDSKKPVRFIFTERWVDAAAQKHGGAALGKDAFTAVMAPLDGPPSAETYELL
jgi:heme oxygenase (mycobilin-producing)